MQKRHRGFTLLEVLVALAIFAVTSAALIKNATQTVKQTSRLETRTIAYWLAENQLTEIRSAPRGDENYPSTGKKRSDAEMAGQRWELLVEIEGTENEDVRRVNVSVFQPEYPDDAIVSLSGFLGRH